MSANLNHLAQATDQVVVFDERGLYDQDLSAGEVVLGLLYTYTPFFSVVGVVVLIIIVTIVVVMIRKKRRHQAE